MVTIKRAGNLLEISDGALGSVLDETLSYYHRQNFFGKDLVDRLQYKRSHPEETKFNPKMSFTKRLMYQIKDGRLYCAAGLKPRVTKVLEGLGIKYEFQDLRSNLLPSANYDKLAELGDITFRHKQDIALATIDTCDGGIIVAPTGWGKGRLLEYLLKVYSKSRIIVISPGLDLLKSTYERLVKSCPDIGRVGGGKYEPEQRVTLCSADSLHKAYFDKAQLIVYDEVHTAGTDSRVKDLARYTNAKFIGLSASFPGRSDGADDLVESIFGPVILRINYKEAADKGAVAPIIVLMVNVPPEPNVSYNYQSPVAWARHVYWRNDYRNSIIAKTVSKIPTWLGQADPQILIMCDKLDHAYELRKQLPDFDLVYATKSDETHKQLVKRKLAKEDEVTMDPKLRTQKRLDFESGKLRKAISTNVWSAGVNFIGLQALVRIDGGVSQINAIQVPGRLSRTKEGKEFGLLIDFYDRHDPKAYRRSLERKKSYGDMGWTIQTIYDLNSPNKLIEIGTDSAKGQRKSVSSTNLTE